MMGLNKKKTTKFGQFRESEILRGLQLPIGGIFTLHLGVVLVLPGILVGSTADL